MSAFVINVLNGISFGMILFLLAAGLSVIIGAMGVLNLAHGALYLLGGYVGWSVAVQFGLNYWLAVLAGGVAACVVGLLIEEGSLRFLPGRLNEQVLATTGFSLMIANVLLWIWGPVAKSPFTLPFLGGSSDILGWKYPNARLFVIGIGLAFAVVLWWFQEKTRLGAMVRAGMDDREMTTAIGINFRRVSIIVFSIGVMMAGMAGVVGSQLLGLNLDLGTSVLLLALVVIVTGGTGSIQGALMAGVLIGVLYNVGTAYFQQVSMFLIYLAMIIVLVFKPSGLMGRRN
jgi:branched-chain amino acid transport system permease protein